MFRPLVLLLLALLLGAPSARAQEAADTLTVELRVTSSRAGAALVDRGAVDGLAVGDRVVLRPREGRTYTATVVDVDERNALIEIHDPGWAPAPGTRGEAAVPSSRLAPPAAPAEPLVEVVEDTPRQDERPPPTWSEGDEEWRDGMPLLAKVRPLRPEQREPRWSGRIFTMGEVLHADDRDHDELRLGADMLFENVRGGDLHVDLLMLQRSSDVPDDDDADESALRVERLSYVLGGTRFEPERIELGRFLQNGMPEFGVLDGIEWSRRRANGHTWGLSLGYMPEPDIDQETLVDAQVAAWYRWIADATERLSFAGGYQKTFHHGDADRDLLVGRFTWLPESGWTTDATVWLDVYTDGDDAKGSGLGVTQAYVSSGRRWGDGDSLDLVYSHLEFPELERDEFTPVLDDQLADDHVDRLGLRARKRIASHALLRAGVGAWADEDDDGADVELAAEVEDLLLEPGTITLGAFGSWGRFASSIGGRLGLMRRNSKGQWGLDYGVMSSNVDGFDEDTDEIPQHRLRLFLDRHTASGWSLSGHLEGIRYDDENAFGAGFYVQKSF